MVLLHLRTLPIFTFLAVLISTAHGTVLPPAISVVITSIHNIHTSEFSPATLTTTIPSALSPGTAPLARDNQYYTESKFSLSLDLHLPTPTCVQTITPDSNGHVPPGSCNALWNYYPSFAAAVATAAIFGVITAVHIGEAIYFKTGYGWVISMSLFWECIGFVFRALSAKNQQSSGILTVSQLAILLAPLWMNAFSYMVLGRMINFYISTHSLLKIKAGTFASCFVLLDIVCFAIQLVGGGMAGVGAPPEQMKKGLDIYKAGIALQEVFVLLFIGLAIVFQLQMHKLERGTEGKILPLEKRTWRKLLYAVYASLVFVSARIIFRLVEFSNGTTSSNEILNVEWYQYAFDSVPIFLAGFVLVISHPGMFLQGPDAVMPVGIVRRWCAARRGKRKLKADMNRDEQGQDGILLIDRQQITPADRS